VTSCCWNNTRNGVAISEKVLASADRVGLEIRTSLRDATVLAGLQQAGPDESGGALDPVVAEAHCHNRFQDTRDILVFAANQLDRPPVQRIALPVSVLLGAESSNAGPQTQPFASPRHWAAFVVNGDGTCIVPAAAAAATEATA
jgi:hypothetical protein